jgi:hypothetical protein
MPDSHSLEQQLKELNMLDYPPPGTEDRWVFINMPICRSYNKLQFAFIFVLFYMNLFPRSASEVIGRPELRYAVIRDLIERSRFSIHDLSYVTLDPESNLPRFNMPFELGMARGCFEYHPNGRHKRLFVFSRKAHEYRICCSDIQGLDYDFHEKDYRRVLTCLRSWFEADVDFSLARGDELVRLFDRYYDWVKRSCRSEFSHPINVEELTFREKLKFTQHYCLYRAPI